MRNSKKSELLNALKAYYKGTFKCYQSVYCMNICLDSMTFKELQANCEGLTK